MRDSLDSGHFHPALTTHALAFEAPDLALVIQELTGRGQVRVHYAADQRLLEPHGASRILSIAILNSDLPRRALSELDTVLARVAGAAADWLAKRDLASRGTLIRIHCLREIDLVLASWTWGRLGRAFWIGDDGRPTLAEPPESWRV